MKRLCLALVGFAQALAVLGQAAGQATNATQNRFMCELHTAQSGALYSSDQYNSYADDLVQALLLDSKGRLFVGTLNGLAVYDGKQWTNRTFKHKSHSTASRAILGLLGISVCGPEKIAEGPPGTIWFGGDGCGVWRFRDGQYSEIASSPVGSDYLGMAVDHAGRLWVVTREAVYNYDGTNWTEVLSPYIAHTVSRELAQLYGIAVDTNGSVWIGGTVYGSPQAPWTHDGAVWLVDQKRRQRADGPPMAGLYEFDGKGWQAFGPPHGLGLRPYAGIIPELDSRGRLLVRTPQGYVVRDGGVWTQVNESDVYAGRQWVLRESATGRPKGFYPELLYRDGNSLVPVRPTERDTGKVFDPGSQSLHVERITEDPHRHCVWLGTMEGLYRIWLEGQQP